MRVHKSVRLNVLCLFTRSLRSRSRGPVARCGPYPFTPGGPWPGASRSLAPAGAAAGRTGGSRVSEDRGPMRGATAFAFVCIVIIFNNSLCDPPTSLTGTRHCQRGDHPFNAPGDSRLILTSHAGWDDRGWHGRDFKSRAHGTTGSCSGEKGWLGCSPAACGAWWVLAPLHRLGRQTCPQILGRGF